MSLSAGKFPGILITQSDVVSAKRICIPSAKPRPIVVDFCNLQVHQLLLRQRKDLKGLGYYFLRCLNNHAYSFFHMPSQSLACVIFGLVKVISWMKPNLKEWLSSMIRVKLICVLQMQKTKVMDLNLFCYNTLNSFCINSLYDLTILEYSSIILYCHYIILTGATLYFEQIL